VAKNRKKHDTWMPLFVGDYIADTGHLTTEQHGAYLLLLMHQWRTGPLPMDARQLARIARMSTSMWTRRCASVVLPFFTETPGGLVQKRLAEEQEWTAHHASLRTESARTAGLKSAQKRKAQAADNAGNVSELKQRTLNGNQRIHNHIEESSLRSDSARPSDRAPVQGALVLPITGGGEPIPSDEPLGERVRREQGGEARRILRSLAPSLAPDRAGELLGTWCKHLSGDRAALLHVLRDAERHAAAERIVGDPIRWLWGLVRQRATTLNHPGASHDQSGRPAERRTYGGGGSAASRLGVLDAFPELAAGMEAD
jgi:uncharacterized protein YdaU (DUF1376 family)